MTDENKQIDNKDYAEQSDSNAAELVDEHHEENVKQEQIPATSDDTVNESTNSQSAEENEQELKALDEGSELLKNDEETDSENCGKTIIEGQASKKLLMASSSAVTEEEEEVDTSDTKPRMIGFGIITLVFGVLIGWSYLAPLDSAAYAPGFVTVENYRKTIQHLEGGIVKSIHTKDGDLVKQGDLLIVLDDTQFKAQLEILDAQYIASLALSARLEAERDNKTDIKFDAYLSERGNDPEVKDVMRIQEQIFTSRSAARVGETEVLKQRIEQLREQVNGLKQQQKSDRKQIQLFDEEIVEFKALLKKGFTDKTRMREMERRVAELEGDVAKNTSGIVAAKIKIGETKLEIIQIENNHQLEVAEQLSQTVTKINDLQERRLAIQDKLSRTNIVAQNTGMVIGMTAHTIGGVVAPGKPILEIVPQGENLIIEAQVSPTDIDRVQTGLISEVRFSAFNSATTPIIEGEVTMVSADSLTDSNTGMPYFLAHIKVTPKGYENLGELKLLPGMPADTLIKTGERTLFEYMTKPIKDAFFRAFKED